MPRSSLLEWNEWPGARSTGLKSSHSSPLPARSLPTCPHAAEVAQSQYG